MRICSIEGCFRRHWTRGWCGMHHARWKRFGNPLALKGGAWGSAINAEGYKLYAGKREHVSVAERALGKKLPTGAVVHHINENRLDNRPENLVICSRAFHQIIHQRMHAMKACGHADWRKCRFCARYDDPINLYAPPHGGTAYHNECRNKYRALKAGKDVPGCRLEQGTRIEIK